MHLACMKKVWLQDYPLARAYEHTIICSLPMVSSCALISTHFDTKVWHVTLLHAWIPKLMWLTKRNGSTCIYAHAAKARHASFTPFLLSIDGLLAREAQFVIGRFADRLSTKWGKPYGKVMGWVRTRLSFAILRATNRCVRGSRVMWRTGIGMEDGAGLAAAMH